MAIVVTNVGLMIINEIQKYVSNSNHDVQTSLGHINTYLGQLMKANTIYGYSSRIIHRFTTGAGEIQVDFTINMNDPTTSIIFRVPEPKKLSPQPPTHTKGPISRGGPDLKPKEKTVDTYSDYDRAMSIF